MCGALIVESVVEEMVLPRDERKLDECRNEVVMSLSRRENVVLHILPSNLPFGKQSF